jgi:anti-sigma regulatory factor (Ser/Thr protein kinase)
MELLVTMPADMRAPQIVRGALGVLAPLFPSAFVDDVRLLTNELVTNAIKHGGLERSDELEIRAESWPERVRVEVVGGTRPVHLRPAGAVPYQTSGWGLLLVGALSNRWGYRHQGETAVWFEIDRARRLAADPLPPEVTRPLVAWRSLRRRRRGYRAS